MPGREYSFRVPRKLKLPMYVIKRKSKDRPGLGAQMIAALELWLAKYGDSVTAGTEPFDPRRDHEDDEFETIAVSFPSALKERISEAAEARRLHNPRLWPDSINAVGIQALKEFSKADSQI